MVTKIIVISSLSLMLVLTACDNPKEDTSSIKVGTTKATQPKTQDNIDISNTEVTPTFCVNPDTKLLLGQRYLDQQFLSVIDAISPVEQDINTITADMILIKGSQFEMGADKVAGFENMPESALPQPDEFPKHPVRVSDYYIDEHEVTVGDYLTFVKATGYKTVAEQDINWEELKKQLPPGTPKPNDEDLKAGALVFHLIDKSINKENLANWWSFIRGANWKSPKAENSDIHQLLNLPVTQVSWYDAMAYAKWRGKRLPTEAEFEYAMRAGGGNTMYPWGNQKTTNNSQQGNFLQGEFPYINTGKDGYVTRAPVKSFRPNAYGLYDMAGNVWEWTNDWYDPDYYQQQILKGTTSINPQGPEKSHEIYQQHATNKVVRGGSFLCNDSWCSGYRNSRRMRLSPDSGMQHLGFRCAKSIINE